ncbi:MAG: phosphatase PAP2 family protein [Chloroflexi bacterium]|nr:phosphatase PAP2 family protein [Chloroflexota bacterium]
MNPDVALFHALNDYVGTVPLIDWLTRALVNDYAVPTALSLAAVALWFAGSTPEERTRNQRAVVFIALAVLFCNALVKDLSYVYFRPRPFATETVKLLFYRPSVSSFPSIPIEVAFCFAAGAWYADRRLGRWLVVLASLYALSRVYAGVHFPSDVIAGAALGAGMVYVVIRLGFVFTPLADLTIRIARRIQFA